MSRHIRNKEYQNDEFHFPSLLLNNFFFLGKYHTKVKNTLLRKSRHDIILTNVYSKLSNVVEKYKGSKKDSRHIIFRKSQETLQGNTWVEWDTKKTWFVFDLKPHCRRWWSLHLHVQIIWLWQILNAFATAILAEA